MHPWASWPWPVITARHEYLKQVTAYGGSSAGREGLLGSGTLGRHEKSWLSSLAEYVMQTRSSRLGRAEL
jgi:hypothetical protein